eukprot:m.189518 g.189518  ORF g.189518 m.189518 type:complete len:191 (+) comp53609_c0_seq2:1011-1583(+)
MLHALAAVLVFAAVCNAQPSPPLPPLEYSFDLVENFTSSEGSQIFVGRSYMNYTASLARYDITGDDGPITIFVNFGTNQSYFVSENPENIQECSPYPQAWPVIPRADFANARYGGTTSYNGLVVDVFYLRLDLNDSPMDVEIFYLQGTSIPVFQGEAYRGGFAQLNIFEVTNTIPGGDFMNPPAICRRQE